MKHTKRYLGGLAIILLIVLAVIGYSLSREKVQPTPEGTPGLTLYRTLDEANSLFAQDKPQEAADKLKSFIAIATDNEEKYQANLLLARAYMEQNQPKLALETYGVVAAIKPLNLTGNLNAAAAAEAASEYKDALKYLTVAQTQTDDSDLRTTIEQSLTRIKQAQDAQESS